jgi:hypothetical protein
MTDSASATPSEFSQPERVRILLTEWSALRAEMVARMTHGYQLLTVATAAITILVIAGTNPATPRLLTYALAIVFAVAYAFAAWFVLRDSFKLRDRLLQIEASINERVGEDLIVWETLWGGLGIGFWGKAKPRPVQFLSTVVPPERTFKGHPIKKQ